MRREYGYFEEDKLGKPYDLRLFRRFFPHIRPYKMLFLLSVVLVSAITVLDLALPYLTKVAIDRYIVQDVADDSRTTQQQRFYTVDLRLDPNARIVKGYPKAFETEWPYAKIPHEDLSKLKDSDLTLLRARDHAGIAHLALVFFLIVVFHFVLSFGNVFVMEYTGQSIMHDLRLRLFSHIQGLSVNFFTRNPVGRLVTRVTSDIQNLHEFFTSIITVLFKDIFLLLGITVVLVVMHWKLALICFLMLPLVFFITTYFSRMARDVFRQARLKIAEINTRLQESIDGIKVIQLFSREGKNYERFKKLNRENYLIGMRQIDIFAVFMPAIELLSSITVALVIWYGGLRVLTDSLSLGILVAFIAYMRMFFRPIRDIAEKYNIMQSAMASSERIFLLLDTREKIPDPELSVEVGETFRSNGAIARSAGKMEGRPPSKAWPDLRQQAGKREDRGIAFDRVWFAYGGKDWILQDISFEVHEGETVAIVGVTGAGKSTLIHLLERFYDPSKGRILVNGVDIRKVPKILLRSAMALITQDVFLFADSIRNNIVAGNPALSDEYLQEIIAGCSLDKLVGDLPEGLDTILTEGGRTLSSGQRQLIAFARALARDPEILILDEATSSVDTQTEKLIQDATLKLMKGRTAIVVAHRLSTIQNADRILTLHGGRIREIESRDEPN